jgi:transposase InsO family protein
VYFCDPHSPWQRGSNENTGSAAPVLPQGHRPEQAQRRRSRRRRRLAQRPTLDRVHHPAARRRSRPVGRVVGDAYDNALAETTVGRFKTEQINRRGPWRGGLDQVEIATLEWVDWYNHRRPHQAMDDFTPVAAEDLHYAHTTALAEVGDSTT